MSVETLSPDPIADIDELRRLKELVIIMDNSKPGEFPPSIDPLLEGSQGLKRLVSAMTILFTDYGGTVPAVTCDLIDEEFGDRYDEFDYDQVLALCKDIQESEIPAQSAVYQQMFEDFNKQCFAGRLPNYKILVVYDIWHWETERLGYPWFDPPACEAGGFIDFAGRQIFLRFLADHIFGWTMAEFLIHEMAHAATDGAHDANWQTEMLRLKAMGAPVRDDDIYDI